MSPLLRALPTHRRTQSDRPARSSTVQIQSYREESDSDGTDSRRLMRRPRQSHSNEVPQHTSPARTPVKPLNNTKVTRSSSVRAKRSLFSQSSRFEIQESPSKKRKQLPASASSANIGTVPRWQTLPFHVLVDIFFQAAPISTEKPTTDTTKEAKWLVGVCRLCRAFFEPAITALYYAPPLHSHGKLPALATLLGRDPSNLCIDYKRKVQRLDISAALPQSRYTDILRLVSLASNLKYVRIYDPTEYGQPRRTFATQVLQELVAKLDSNNCRLHHWEWNKRQIPVSIEKFHLRPSFEPLRTIRLYNLDFEDFSDADTTHDDNPHKTFAEEMAVALSRLQNLRDIDFTNCEIVGYGFLLSLPDHLNSITFRRCDRLTSDNIGRFLLSHGGHLRSLVLANNRELNMSFTTMLQESCPKLQIFKMDLNFSSPTLFAYDVEPHFNSLFADSEIPKWPTALRVLQLERLRKWDGDTASRFFDDLVDSAPRLTNLRSLIVTAIVDVDWRERAKLREVYGSELERIYLRKPSPLDFKAQSPAPRETDHDPSPSPIRKSSRLAKKVVGQGEIVVQTEALGAAGPKDSSSNYIQGLCHTVEIRMDNLRPADVLLTVDSFQDNEPSDDDDDWNGDDLVLDSGHAW